MKTRLHVEHAVTDLVAGLGVVQEQFRLAGGAPLSARAFAPMSGRITRRVMPAWPGVRVDMAIDVGDRIPPVCDPHTCKLIVHAADRPAARGRLRRALDETEIGGIQTTLPFHRAMLAESAFLDATGLSTTWVDAHWDGPVSRGRAVRVALLVAGLAELGEAATGEPGGSPSPAGSNGLRHAADPANRDGSVPAWSTSDRALATDRWPA